jgi:hypothetical protein
MVQAMNLHTLQFSENNCAVAAFCLFAGCFELITAISGQ